MSRSETIQSPLNLQASGIPYHVLGPEIHEQLAGDPRVRTDSRKTSLRASPTPWSNSGEWVSNGARAPDLTDRRSLPYPSL
jgi:hypothetical protein